MNKAIATCALALICSAGVQAQTVYRCGNTFSQKPCEGAQPLQLEPRNPTRDEAAAAEANARRDAKLADGLEKERLAQEKAAAKALVLPQPNAVVASTPRDSASLPKASIKGRKLEQFKATAPAKPGEQPQKSKKKKSSG